MTSWRDTATQQAQDDLDGLLSPALGFAQQQLDKHGEFYPYAVAVDLEGQQRLVAVDSDEDRPASVDLIASLGAILAEQREALRAAAIVSDVHVPQLDQDAIRVQLEHGEHIALVILLPYRKARFGRGIKYGDLQASAGEPSIWPVAQR